LFNYSGYHLSLHLQHRAKVSFPEINALEKESSWRPTTVTTPARVRMRKHCPPAGELICSASTSYVALLTMAVKEAAASAVLVLLSLVVIGAHAGTQK